MGSGTMLYKYLPGMDADWTLVKDMSEYGVKNITRIVSQKNSLVVVDSE